MSIDSSLICWEEYNSSLIRIFLKILFFNVMCFCILGAIDDYFRKFIIDEDKKYF